jgi:hypothetical protein
MEESITAFYWKMLGMPAGLRPSGADPENAVLVPRNPLPGSGKKACLKSSTAIKTAV